MMLSYMRWAVSGAESEPGKRRGGDYRCRDRRLSQLSLPEPDAEEISGRRGSVMGSLFAAMSQRNVKNTLSPSRRRFRKCSAG